MTRRLGLLVLLLALLARLPGSQAHESPSAAAARQRRVAERRAGTQIICHRGALEFAHENTLEAYRATFELGGDGNEIDIRATKDGVLVCFHDDMLDHLLAAYGDVGDYTWEQLRKFPFRRPGPFGPHCRIPTLREVLELHREQAGLLHLDVKRPGLVEPITRLLDEFDMWDHVVQAPAEYTDSRLRRGSYKAGLYLDRSEVDAAAIARALDKPGDSVIVEDPRGVAVALGRTIRRPSPTPVRPVESAQGLEDRREGESGQPSSAELIKVLSEVHDWNIVAIEPGEEAASAERIERRARAADDLARLGARADEIFEVLEGRVRHRSLHRHWRYCGLDGAAALRALFALEAPHSKDLARFCLWRDDPAVEAAANPDFHNPRSWTDWRTKMIVFDLLSDQPGPASEQICRDYLALSDDEAARIGPLQFEAAAKALLAINPAESTVSELLQHRLSVVRGRAILFCLSRPDTPWARKLLQESAPPALQYVLSG